MSLKNGAEVGVSDESQVINVSNNPVENMHYPNALTIWKDCIFLGGFEVNGKKYDLGVACAKQEFVACVDAVVVCSDKPGDYLSWQREQCETIEPYKEVFRRWDAYRAGQPLEKVWQGIF